MRNEIEKLIQNSGYKRKYIAQKVGVSYTMLWYYLKGEKNLSDEKISKLLVLLRKG